jgi:hypothetical protein
VKVVDAIGGITIDLETELPMPEQAEAARTTT